MHASLRPGILYSFGIGYRAGLKCCHRGVHSFTRIHINTLTYMLPLSFYLSVSLIVRINNHRYLTLDIHARPPTTSLNNNNPFLQFSPNKTLNSKCCWLVFGITIRTRSRVHRQKAYIHIVIQYAYMHTPLPNTLLWHYTRSTYNFKHYPSDK